MDNVKIGVIGIGNMGSSHAMAIFEGKVRGLSLAAVCDTDEDKLAWAKQNLSGVAVFGDDTEMIAKANIDAVLVATPHYDHCKIAINALSKNKHVLIEKPAGVYTKQVAEMNETAQKSGKVFCIMYNQRTSPMYQKVRELVQSGVLGEPKRFIWIITNWFRTQKYYDSGSWRATWAGEGGGVLLNQCPHNLDLWQWIFGMPNRVQGFCSYGKYHHIEVEDDVTAYAEYENGATAVFITTTGECPGTNRLEITGDRAKIVLEDKTIKLWTLEKPEREVCFYSESMWEVPKTQYQEIVPKGEETSHTGIMQNFTNSILHGEPLLAPGYEGMNGLTLSNAIHLSDWTGKPVSLPIDADLFEKKLKEKAAASVQKTQIKSEISDLSGSYSSRWDIK